MPTTWKEDEVGMYDRRTERGQGCFSLVLVILLALSLLACGVVQKVAEPIDKQGCRTDCRNCEFSQYEYAAHHCYCLCNGIEIRLY